jgi:hypothetical protein
MCMYVSISLFSVCNVSSPTKIVTFGHNLSTANWFWSCLTNRRQKVGVQSCNRTQKFFSDWGTLKHGVPQGPLLFIYIYIYYMNNIYVYT